MKSYNPCDTLQYAYILSNILECKDLLIIEGNIGVGKTLFTKGIGIGLGIPKDKIISPSFILVREYYSNVKKINFLHIDAYRLNSKNEFNNFIDTDKIYNSLTIVEWGFKKVEHIANNGFLLIELSYISVNENQLNQNYNIKLSRKIRISGFGKRWNKRISINLHD